MKIRANTQLGLMEWNKDMMKSFVDDSRSFIAKQKEYQSKNIHLKDSDDPQDGEKLHERITNALGYKKENSGAEFYIVRHPKPYYYLIQPSVFDCAEKIKIGKNFSCSIFNKIKDGEHVYLLGENEFYRFVKFNGVVKASFWNRKDKISFEAGFDLLRDQFYAPNINEWHFHRMLRIMIFIELGDIEITVIEKGRNNGKTKADGKIINETNNSVYVVDSSWNKIIIRTEGFAVMGHFRLQPCGKDFCDRKLIWIDAFEKHGYVRRPKAEIIH